MLAFALKNDLGAVVGAHRGTYSGKDQARVKSTEIELINRATKDVIIAAIYRGSTATTVESSITNQCTADAKHLKITQ